MKNSKKQKDELVAQFHALSSPIRLRMVEILTQREHCACEFPGLLSISQPNASRNLNILKKAGLVKSVRDGQRILYSLDPIHLESIRNRLKELMESFTGISFTVEKISR